LELAGDDGCMATHCGDGVTLLIWGKRCWCLFWGNGDLGLGGGCFW